jgi:hypothetical protein
MKTPEAVQLIAELGELKPTWVAPGVRVYLLRWLLGSYDDRRQAFLDLLTLVGPDRADQLIDTLISIREGCYKDKT